MRRVVLRRWCAAFVSVATVLSAPSAWADEPAGRGHDVEHFDVTHDPLLTDDALIGDDAEGQAVDSLGVTCSYETVQTAPNAAPASGSFQHLYVVPNDVTATSSLDVPRSCSDGSVKYSSLARASRNMASWLAKQSAGLNYRTLTITYTHNYTGAQYATRGVRRFRSVYTKATWSSLAMYEQSTKTSPRLTRLRNELTAAGFDKSNTKYLALLDAGSQTYDCTAAGTCKHTVGVADTGGAYGMTVRYYSGTGVYVRYGCATDGDVVMAHEQTHQLGVSHVSDHVDDLMATAKSTRNFKSSPSTIWDYGRNTYHSTVRAHAFVSTTSLSGSYFTC